MKTLLRSKELSCPSCVAKIEAQLLGIDGVHTAEVYFTTGKIVVEHDSEKTTQQQLIDAVRAAGYESYVSGV